MTLDGQPAPMWTSLPVKRGQTVKVGATTGARAPASAGRPAGAGVRFGWGRTPQAAARRPPAAPAHTRPPRSRAGGSRTYIAIAGGLDVPDYLGSKSTFPGGAMGGHQGRALRPGDMLFLAPAGERFTTGSGVRQLGAGMAWACTAPAAATVPAQLLPPPSRWHASSVPPTHPPDLSKLAVGVAVPPAWRPAYVSGTADWEVGVLPGPQVTGWGWAGAAWRPRPPPAAPHTPPCSRTRPRRERPRVLLHLTSFGAPRWLPTGGPRLLHARGHPDPAVNRVQGGVGGRQVPARLCPAAASTAGCRSGPQPGALVRPRRRSACSAGPRLADVLLPLTNYPHLPPQVHHNSNRLGVRLEGPRPQFARADGGEGGSHPSNVHDHVYALGAINFTGDM